MRPIPSKDHSVNGEPEVAVGAGRDAGKRGNGVEVGGVEKGDLAERRDVSDRGWCLDEPVEIIKGLDPAVMPVLNSVTTCAAPLLTLSRANASQAARTTATSRSRKSGIPYLVVPPAESFIPQRLFSSTAGPASPG